MAIELIVTHVKKMLKQRSVKFRERMARSDCLIMRELDPSESNIFDGITLLPETPQVKVKLTEYECAIVLTLM